MEAIIGQAMAMQSADLHSQIGRLQQELEELKVKISEGVVSQLATKQIEIADLLGRREA